MMGARSGLPMGGLRPRVPHRGEYLQLDAVLRPSGCALHPDKVVKVADRQDDATSEIERGGVGRECRVRQCFARFGRRGVFVALVSWVPLVCGLLGWWCARR